MYQLILHRVRGRLRLLALFIGLILASIVAVQPANALDIVIGNERSPTYKLGIGVSSLVKVKLLPATGIDLNPVITTGDEASLAALQDGAADFALVALDNGRSPTDTTIQALATLGRIGTEATTLLVRRDVDDESVRQILEVLFDGVDFLTTIDPQIEDLSPDSAVMGLSLPLHRGAKQFYAGWWATSPERDAQVAAIAPAVAPAAEPASDEAAPVDDPDAGEDRRDPAADGATGAQNFVIYFGFDDSSLSSDAEATLREAAAFAATLDAPAIIVAGYTDSVGDAEYNYLLAERRAEAVLAEVEELDVAYSRIDLALYGERSPWSVTRDDVSEADNRRVELFIEEPVQEVQPLPAPAGHAETTRSTEPKPLLQTTTAPVRPVQPAGGPKEKIRTIAPSAPARPLM